MKDAQGHGSNGRGSGGIADAIAKSNASFGARSPVLKSGDQLGDRGSGGQQSGNPVTAGGHGGDWGNMAAASSMASGPKSEPVPTHDSMGGRGQGYSPDAVNKAIAASNRSGQRIGGREASMIHALLKGRYR
jgi:hypothetical protein